MSRGLPYMTDSDGIRKSTQIVFGGYNHNAGAVDGGIWDMQNMCSDDYPIISVRPPRYRVDRKTIPGGMYGGDGFFYLAGSTLYKDGKEISGLILNSGDIRQFASLGRYLVILPDKKYYDRDPPPGNPEYGELELTITDEITFEDGVYAGKQAKMNRLWGRNNIFINVNVGDAVTITSTANPDKEITAVVREKSRIQPLHNYLDFDENIFFGWANRDSSGNKGIVTVKRTVPDMDFICECNNRLWGCKGDTIYASKLGDIFNWNVFDGLSTDSYAVDVGSVGDFTGCCTYQGHPTFFKEDYIHKVYGDRPSNFQVTSTATLGVRKNSGASLAIAGERLYYLSRAGVVSYSGGVPVNISYELGNDHLENAVGGSDGEKYYVLLKDGSSYRYLYVYDTQKRMWHKEDRQNIVSFCWSEELYFQTSDGEIWTAGKVRSEPSPAVTEGRILSFVEFNDFYEAGPNRAGTAKLQLRLELDAGAEVKVYMSFDSGPFEVVSSITADGKKSFYLPLIPRRSDHFRVRIEGTGMWKLHSLTRECYKGSES